MDVHNQFQNSGHYYHCTNNRVMGMATSTMGWWTLLHSEGDTPSRAAVRPAGKYLQVATWSSSIFFPFVVLYKQGDWCRRVVTVMVRAGTPNCISFFATRHPKEKDAPDKFVFLCIYMVNITYIYDRENWWMLTSESSGWHFVGGALKAPCSCRRRNFIILGGRNGVEKCRVAIKMSFSYYELFFCYK